MQTNILHMATLGQGYGVERQLVDHLTFTNRNPNEIKHHVCALELCDPLMQELRAEGIPFIFNPLRSLKQFKEFAAFIKKYNIHILHVHDRLKTPLRARILPKLAGIPFIVEHERGYVWRPFSTRFLNSIQLIKWTNKMVNINICNSNAAKIILKHKCNIDARVIYNGVKIPPDIENISDHNKFKVERGLSEDTKLVGFVGRLNTPKGVPAFIRSIPLIKQAVPQTKFVIVGDGPMRNELEASAESLGVSNDVYFLGYRKNAREYMQQVDVMVVPSLYEPFGNVVIEAAFAKKPVVASNVDGIAETVIDGETGFLVDCTEPIYTNSAGASKLALAAVDGRSRKLRPPLLPNVEMLSERVIKCLLDPEMTTSLGNNAYLRAKSVFSLERYRNDIDNLYREIMKSYIIKSKSS